MINCKTLSVMVVMVLISLWTSAGAFYLPDTGQRSCYGTKGTTNVITCPAPGQSTAQDGSYLYYPPSYTPVAETVRDNNTRLIWQQGGDGMSRSWDEAAAYCEDLSGGGYDDWRLPSSLELFDLVDFGSPIYPVFPSGSFGYPMAGKYWTGTSFGCGSNSAVSVDFAYGNLSSLLRTDRYYTRCVRDVAAKRQNLVDNRDATVSDTVTGLTWQQGEGGRMKWGEALNYCENLSLGNQSDWRLPNVRELASLFDINGERPIDAQFFPQAEQNYYWSSTSYARNPENKWIVNYFMPLVVGTAADSDKDIRTNAVRCVRGKKADLRDGQELTVSSAQLDFFIPGGERTVSQPLTLANNNTSLLSISRIIPPSPPSPLFSMTARVAICKGLWIPAPWSLNSNRKFLEIIRIAW